MKKQKETQKLFFLSYKIRKRALKSLLVVLVGIFLLPTIAYPSSINEENIIKLTNNERTKAGLNIVTANQLLAKAAFEKGQAIIEHQRFKHDLDNKRFSAWIKDTGYEYAYVGENLAIDFVTSEGVIKAWLKSPSHKKNLLNSNFKEIGVAVIENEFQGANTILIVQIFGEPLAGQPLLGELFFNEPNQSSVRNILPEPSQSLFLQKNTITLNNNLANPEFFLQHTAFESTVFMASNRISIGAEKNIKYFNNQTPWLSSIAREMRLLSSSNLKTLIISLLLAIIVFFLSWLFSSRLSLKKIFLLIYHKKQNQSG